MNCKEVEVLRFKKESPEGAIELSRKLPPLRCIRPPKTNFFFKSSKSK